MDTRLPASSTNRLGRVRPPSAVVLAALLLAAVAAAAVPLLRVAATNLSDFTVTPASGGTDIPPSTAGGAWTTLKGPAIDITPYSNPDVFPPGLAFTLTLPTNFEWNTTVTTAPVVSVAAGMPAGFCTLVPSGLTYAGSGTAPRTVRFTLAGTHDIGCVVSLRGLQLRPISAEASAGTGGKLTVDWGAPSLGVSRAIGGVVSLAVTSAFSLPPTDTALERGAAPVLPGAAVGLVALLAAGWALLRRDAPTR